MRAPAGGNDMLKVTIICVGRLKERFYVDAAEEYRKRLSGYCKLDILEIPEYRLPDNPSEAQIAAGLRKEWDAIVKRLPARACTVALCVEGREVTSSDFEVFLNDCVRNDVSGVCFIIGGSYGLHEGLKQALATKLSLSAMTFPHHLARIILLEQLYRAFSIAGGGKYHK